MKIKLKYTFPGSIKWFAGIIILSALSISGYSQNAGISANGSVPPNTSAGLDVNFSAQGLLIPRIALASATSFLPLSSHIAGMVIYNTSAKNDVLPGVYINNGNKWIQGFPKAIAAGDMLYWDGTTWVAVSAGQPGQLLQLNISKIPVWTGGGYATMTTTAISSITSATASSGGTISSDGGNAISARGVCWATAPNPTIAGSKTTNGSGTGTFISNITGLASATTYYLRAYATNSSGTSYGNLTVFGTP